MFAGKIFKCEKAEYRAYSNLTGAGGSSLDAAVKIQHGSTVSTFFTPDYVGVNPGIFLQCVTSYFATTTALQPDASPLSEYTFYLDPIRQGTFSDSTFRTNIDTLLEATNLALYMNSFGRWELHIETLKWFCNGVLRGEWSGLNYSSSMTPTPCAIPFFSNMVSIKDECEATWGFQTGVILANSQIADASSTVGGGYRFKIDGEWYQSPCTRPPIVAINGTIEGEVEGIFNISNTWESTLSVYEQNNREYQGNEQNPVCTDVTDWLYFTRIRQRHGTMTLFADLPKGVQRLNDDYGALIIRGGFPRVTSTSAKAPTEEIEPGPSVTSIETNVYPTRTQFLSTVQNAPHQIETDVLSYPTYSWITGTFTWVEGELIVSINKPYTVISADGTGPYFPPSFCVTPTPPPEINEVKGSFKFPGAIYPSGQELSYLTHLSNEVLLANTWGNPMWSYLLYMPTEEQNLWRTSGTFATPQEYWLNARSQVLDHPSLPTDERLKIRNDIVSEPLWQNGLAGLIRDQVYGQITSWWGCPRPVVDQTIPLALVSMDVRTPVIGVEGKGTATAEADGVHVTGATNAEFEIPVGQHDSHPFMNPYLAVKVRVGCQAANVSEVQFDLIDSTGVAVRVPFDNVFGSLREAIIPTGEPEKYAGSWAQEFGVGFIPEQGADIDGEGASTSFMVDRDRVAFMAMANGRQYVKLRVRVTLTDPDETAIVLWPQWLTTTGYADNVKSYVEVGQVADVIVKNGPGFRYGQQSYYSYLLGAVLDTPYASQLSGMATALDWLCFKRNVYEARLATDGLSTEIGDIWDEGIEWTQVKHLAADPFTQSPMTHSFISPSSEGPKGVMINSFSQVPALQGYPNVNLDAALRPDGFTNKAWSLIGTRRHSIFPGDGEAFLQSPSDENWLIELLTLDGWSVWYHRREVTGLETRDWQLGKDGKVFAEVFPWHGYFWASGFIPVAGTNVSYDVDYASLLHVFALIDEDGKVRIGTSGNDLALTWVTTDIDAQWICIKIDRDSQDQRLLLVVEDSESVKMYESVDRGEAFTLADTIGTGTKPFIFVGRGGTRHIFWHNEGEIKGQIRDRFNATIETTFTARAGVDDAGCAADEDVTESGERRVHLVVVEGGAVVHLDSEDGKTFT